MNTSAFGWSSGGSGGGGGGATTNYGLYAQTAISATVTNTVIETSIVGAGVGTLTVPAFSFTVGASFQAKIGGEISNLNNTQIRFRVQSIAATLVDTGFLTIKQDNNQFWLLNIDFTIRQVGAAGVASIISNGDFTHIRNNGAVEMYGFNTINNTTFDTTIINTLDITVEWQTASPQNSIHSDYFVLNKTY